MFAPHTDEQARAQVVGLIDTCPHGTPVDDCPFTGLRSLDRDGRSLYAQGADQDECHGLCRQHAACYARRCGDH